MPDKGHGWKLAMGNRPGLNRHAVAWCLMAGLMVGTPVGLAASDYLGQVTFNGVPVPGVTVTATQGDRRVVATTDQDGLYRLTDLAEGAWNVVVEMLGFVPMRREITVPAETEPPPFELAVRSFDELVRELPVQHQAAATATSTPSETAGTPAQDGSGRTGATVATPQPAGVLAALPDTAPVEPTGMGAADGLLINGSLNNGASTLFAQPRAFGNNRPNQRSLYTYAAGILLGSSAWDARPYSLTGVQPSTPSYTNADALGTFQGPVRLPGLTNPINVFVGYQGRSDTNTSTQWARLPTDRERAGDFTGTLDPFGAPVRVVDPATGLPFEGNVLPAARISPQAAALLGYYPRAGDAAAGRFNYQAPIVTATRQHSVQSRAAYSIDPRNQINGTASYQRTDTDATSLFRFENARRFSTLDAQANWSHRFSPFATLRTRYQYTRAGDESLPHFANRVNVSGDAGITGNDQDPLNWGPPSLSFASDLAGLADARYASGTQQAHTWGAEGSRFRGRHTITAGGEVRRSLNDVIGQQDPRGSFAFTGAATGVDFADFLLGLPQTSAIAFGNADKSFRGESYAAYVTDDWRVSPSLTLNVGVRWEYESPMTETRARLVNLDVAPGFTAISPVLAGGTGALTGRAYSDALLRTDKGGVQPRLGLAWRPMPGSSLVVRAGYGIYRNTNVYGSIATLLAQQPPLSTTFNIETSASDPLTLADGFSPSGSVTRNTFAVDPDFRVGFVENWQVSAQRDLPQSLTVMTTYLGARGSRLMQQFVPNTYPAGAEHPCPSCPTGFRYLTSGGRSIRHAGQVQLRRRLRNGFTSSVQYTLSKAMDNATAFAGASADSSALAQNWLDLEAEYARSNFDQRHLVAVTAEYTTGAGVMGGTLVDGWKGRLLKDWTIATTLNAGSGLPLTPVYFAPIRGTGIVGPIRPDVVGDPDAVPDGYYADAAAYAPPAEGRWGSAGRNSITGPRTFSLSASLARTFRVGDRLNMDWRIEATNVLNSVTYAGVNTLITSPQFGLPRGTNDMRKLRSSLRLRF
jgi:hypothetical protein